MHYFFHLQEDIYNLLDNFSNKKCLYILGSGVSIQYVPSWGETRGEICQKTLERGVFLNEINIQKDNLHNLIIGTPPSNQQLNFLEMLYYEALPNSLIENLYLNIIQPKPLEDCPEYEIFNLSNKAIFFNFNHDGLLRRFVKRDNAIYLHPHGEFPDHAINFLQSLDDISIEYKLNLANNWKIHLPIEENSALLNTKPYLDLCYAFPEIDCVYIIGYSFCRQLDGKFHDEKSYNYIMDLANFFKKEIIIVSPEPYTLANRIKTDFKSLKPLTFKAEWNILTQAILNSIRFYPFIYFIRAMQLYNTLNAKGTIPKNTSASWLYYFGLYLKEPSRFNYLYKLASEQFIPIRYYGYKKFPYNEIARKFIENSQLN